MRARLVLIVGAVVVVATLGLRACTTTTDGQPESSDMRSRASAAGPGGPSVGPARVVGGVPQGWAHNAAGARAAAVSAVGLTGAIARAGFITRADMITALATARYGPTLVRESAAQLDAWTRELGAAGVASDALVFAEWPLTAKAARADAATARVQVWSVVVVGVPGKGTPRQVWRTVTVDLAWEAGDWRIDGWTVEAGPTPMLAAHPPVATVDEVATVTGWPAATASTGSR